VHPVNPVAGAGTDKKRDNQQYGVDDRTPHEKTSDGFDFHGVPPFPLSPTAEIACRE
jgi:hypothetical protein